MRTIWIFLLLVVLISGCSGRGDRTVEVTSTPAGPILPSPVASTTSPAPTATLASTATQPAVPLVAGTATATPVSGITSARPAAPGELPFPIRAAFYYPWFPQAWNQSHINPFAQYHPALGFYRSDDITVIQQHIAAMQYGKIQVGIASWWGQGHHTDSHVLDLLKAGQAANFYWALYFEREGSIDPTPESIRADLEYIRDHYASSPVYLKINGRFVVFVYAQPTDACGMADRWKQANTVGAYMVLKVFAGYRACASQPEAWHQYAPANAQKQQGMDSFTISPGFWKAGEELPLLNRDLPAWSKNIQAMIASKANFQLITTFNEWGEGTAVENAQEWTSPSGYGAYLDALHNDGLTP